MNHIALFTYHSYGTNNLIHVNWKINTWSATRILEISYTLLNDAISDENMSHLWLDFYLLVPKHR